MGGSGPWLFMPRLRPFGGRWRVTQSKKCAAAISCRLAAGLRLFRFPGALRALRFRHVAAFYAVVDVTVADSAQRLVIEADLTGGLAQLLGKLVQRLEVVGGGGNFSFAGLEEFLVALIDQPRNLAAHQVAGLGKQTHTAVGSAFDGGGA